MKRIAFTGPRPKKLCGYDIQKYGKFVASFSDYLKSYMTEDTEFISGGAQGFDQLAFWAVDGAKNDISSNISIKNTVYVPHKRQPEVWKKDGLFGQTQYAGMINAADSVRYIEGELYNKSEIVASLMARNHAMVDKADIVIALYPDDKWKTEMGSGTAECMRYAHNKGKTIHQVTFEIDNDGNLIPTNLYKIEPKKDAEPIRISMDFSSEKE